MTTTAIHRINTFGLAAVTAAGLVALPPLAPPQVATVAAPTELTGFWTDLITPYVDLVQHTVGNTGSIIGDWIEHPFPVLGQILDNWWGYATDIFGALLRLDIPGFFAAIDESARTIVQNGLNVIHTLTSTAAGVDLDSVIDGIEPPANADLVSALLAAQLGNDSPAHALIQGVIDQVDSVHVNLGMALALIVDAAGGPVAFLNAADTSNTAFDAAITNGDWGQALTLLLTWPANMGDGTLNAPGISIDSLSTTLQSLGLPSIDELLSRVGPFDLGTQQIDLPGLGLATVNLGTIQLTGLAGTAPLTGALSPLENASVNADLDWSGATVRFADVCLPVIGCNANPLNFTIGATDFNGSVDLDGTPTGGLVPALVNWAPQQLADSISDTTPGSWDDLFNQVVGLPGYLWDQFSHLISLIPNL